MQQSVITVYREIYCNLQKNME